MKKLLLSVILFLMGSSSVILLAHTLADNAAAKSCACNRDCNGNAPDNWCSKNNCGSNKTGICEECRNPGGQSDCRNGQVCVKNSNGKNVCRDAPAPPPPPDSGIEPGYVAPPANYNCAKPPTDIMFVIDESASMARDGNMGRAKFAARSFVSTIQESSEFLQVPIRIGLASFNERGQIKIRPTGNYDAVRNAISNLSPSNDLGTCLECALDHPKGSNDTLNAFTGGGNTKKVVIILTDGNITRWVNNDGQIVGSRDEQDKARENAKAAARRLTQRFGHSVQFWVIQFGSGDHAGDFRDIARLSNPYGPGSWEHARGNNWNPIFDEYASKLRGAFIYAGAFDRSNSGAPLANWTAVVSCGTGSRKWQTRGDGWAFFTSVPTGFDYRISFEPPPNYGPATPADISKPAGVIEGIPSGHAAEFGGVCTPGWLPPNDDECDGTFSYFIRLASISGCVYNDINSSGTMDLGEAYTGSPNIVLTGNLANGTPFAPRSSQTACYNFQGLPYGNYTLSYSNIPNGYKLTFPTSGNTYNINYFGVFSCSGSPRNSLGQPSCSNANITNANFGITNAIPWLQTAAFNVRNDQGGFDNPIQPTSQCTTTMMRNGNGGTPGILYSAGANIFGTGTASSRNWVVTNSVTDPTRYNPGERLKTSYDEMMLTLTRNEITPTPLTSLSGCTTPSSSCTINNLNSTAYTTSGNVNLGPVHITNQQKAVILVNGTLRITQNVRVDPGSFLMFVVRGDIIVQETVGRAAGYMCGGESAAQLQTTELQGIYATNSDFRAQGYSCLTPNVPRYQLNIAGSVITNTDATGGGRLNNNRTLCAANLQRPALTITPRLDFILNAPAYMLRPSTTWQEVAP